ncbi:UNVERIFIED_CONTAM: hypothetical protein K2H54_065969 [Gekko kuhli]
MGPREVVNDSGASSSHSLRFFDTAVSEPSPGLPQFISVGYVDEQPIDRYDSITKRDIPQVSWMEEYGKDNPKFWEMETQKCQHWESVFRANLVTLRKLYSLKNSTGLHTWQRMCACEVGPDGRPRGGHFQHAYDGEDFLILDRETITWTASVPQALVIKRRWEKELPNAEYWKSYLEEVCVEWLRSFLVYGKEILQRTERPTVRVARKKGHDGRETLFCQLYGFYPKEVEVTWMKDGEDQRMETWTGGVVPNSDGTYNTWLSIEVDPKEKDRYRCQVGHNSLLEPLDLAWEEPASIVGLILGIVGIVGGVLLAALILVGAGVAFDMHKQQQEDGYATASITEQRERPKSHQLILASSSLPQQMTQGRTALPGVVCEHRLKRIYPRAALD